MVSACQVPNASILSVNSAHADAKRVLNSYYSCPHLVDSLAGLAARNNELVSVSRSCKGPLSCSNGRCQLVDMGQLDGSDSHGSRPFSMHGGRLKTRCLSGVSRVDIPFSVQSLEQGRRQLITRCTASEETSTNGRESDTLVELPLFPLPLVLFPGAILPLQVFEFRYRIMMHTLLQTDLRFGVVYSDKVSGLAGVGCVGEVVKHERLVDDRFFMICKGQERFRVVEVVRTKPYLVAKVAWLEDRPSSDEQDDAEVLANEVETYMKDVIRLSNRVNGKPEKAAPEDLRKKLFPTPFSFWVGSTFEGAPVEQQALLELEDTAQRLKREKQTLRNTLNYLSAASAVKDAFPSAE